MPGLEAFLHYRIVDVSSIKELARRWFSRAYFQAPTKRGNHRALADIQESIEELRYYREAVFVPSPGPDSDAARAIAEKHGGAQPAFRSLRRKWPWQPRIPIPRNPPDSPSRGSRLRPWRAEHPRDAPRGAGAKSL